jgi:hypothetical protein
MSFIGRPPTFDNEDLVILANRVILLDADERPRVGDFVRFLGQPPEGKDADIIRRISHIWDYEGCEDPRVQTSDGGSYYLGDGYVSMSGSLYTPVPQSSLKRTVFKRKGSVWFFHHDFATGHNGVNAEIDFRLYDCKLPAPTS